MEKNPENTLIRQNYKNYEKVLTKVNKQVKYNLEQNKN